MIVLQKKIFPVKQNTCKPSSILELGALYEVRNCCHLPCINPYFFSLKFEVCIKLLIKRVSNKVRGIFFLQKFSRRDSRLISCLVYLIKLTKIFFKGSNLEICIGEISYDIKYSPLLSWKKLQLIMFPENIFWNRFLLNHNHPIGSYFI